MINIGDIRDYVGKSVSATFGTRKADEFLRYFVICILALALVQRNINQTLFESGAFKQMISAVNQHLQYMRQHLQYMVPIMYRDFMALHQMWKGRSYHVRK